jgi:hypothetical protein
LKLCENVFGKEFFHDLGFSESHWLLLKNEREILMILANSGVCGGWPEYTALCFRKQGQSGQA